LRSFWHTSRDLPMSLPMFFSRIQANNGKHQRLDYAIVRSLSMP
jgi:hypothetical protein